MSYKHQAINVFMTKMTLPIRAIHVQIDDISAYHDVHVISTGKLHQIHSMSLQVQRVQQNSILHDNFGF